MQFLDTPTRNLFFTGKGGVGKTSMACLTALKLADRGRSVLLVSTDPASNLDEVLGQSIGVVPTPIPGAPGLSAMNIDPEAAASEYRERLVGPYRGVLPEAALQSMEEQLSGSCTLEIAAFDEFSKLVGDESATQGFDHVVFDTAPTGHTLRLLSLPSAWSGFVDANTTGTSCLGPLAGLQEQQAIYKRTVSSLCDPLSTTLMLVTRAEPSAFREAGRTCVELRNLGINHQHLIINGVFTCQSEADPLAVAMQQRNQDAIDALPDSLAQLEKTIIPLQSTALMGIDTLRNVATDPYDDRAKVWTTSGSCKQNLAGLETLVDQLAPSGRGVVLAMGKGGVGKTTIAAALAVALADRGCNVHLSTTDPAAHVLATVAAEEQPGLTIGRIDPRRETEEYTAEVMRSSGAGLDEAGKALLEEDLRSPCTEEVAVFRAFARVVAQAEDRFVVLDTAPTGHTILLLDAALAYHREVTRQTHQMPESVERLLPRLRDPDFTRVILVTLPEATPVHEAAQLQDDLRRAKIQPYAWVINQSLTPLAVSDPVLRARQAHEWPFIEEVDSTHADRVALVAWKLAPPTGIAGLRDVAAGT